MKIITIADVGEVVIRKSRLAKRLILKIDQTGKPVVTIPSYAPYKIAENYARKHAQWFKDNIDHSIKPLVLSTGSQIGEAHRLTFTASDTTKISSRVGTNSITVNHPKELAVNAPEVQKEAQKAAVRALRRQAEAALPSRLHQLAQTYGYSYREVRIKTVQTRWGSCSSNRIINLSVWLMQLPHSLQDYVLCHELAHLNNMNHSAAFWAEVATMIPDYKLRRKHLKQFSPRLLQT
jgi:hypothetical protein